MTIYTSPSLTIQPHNGYCEGGAERVKAALAKHGLSMESIVPMRMILDELGVSDTVFSFCKVCKGSEKEAEQVLHTYMLFLYEGAVHQLAGVDLEPYGLKAIRKRCEGHNRPHLLVGANKAMAYLRNSNPNPTERYALKALEALSMPVPDEIAAVHAGQALMQMGEAAGDPHRIQDMLRRKLEELMPREDK